MRVTEEKEHLKGENCYEDVSAQYGKVIVKKSRFLIFELFFLTVSPQIEPYQEKSGDKPKYQFKTKSYPK